MANANTPFGFKPVKNSESGYESGGLEMFYVPATDGTALYVGDPVGLAASLGAAISMGLAEALSDDGVVSGRGNPWSRGAITGIVMGFVPDGTTDIAGYRAASTAAYVLVCTNPEEAFIVQEDGVVVVRMLERNEDALVHGAGR